MRMKRSVLRLVRRVRGEPELERCRKCGAGSRPLRVEYGLPDERMSERAARGEIFLGGEFVDDYGQGPRFVCSICYEPLD